MSCTASDYSSKQVIIHLNKWLFFIGVQRNWSDSCFINFNFEVFRAKSRRANNSIIFIIIIIIVIIIIIIDSSVSDSKISNSSDKGTDLYELKMYEICKFRYL